MRIVHDDTAARVQVPAGAIFGVETTSDVAESLGSPLHKMLREDQILHRSPGALHLISTSLVERTPQIRKCSSLVQ